MMLKVLFCTILIASITYCDDLCPDDHLKTCQDDISQAYSLCQKAAKQKGKDQQADADCIKYFTAMRKQCWPCVCKYAEQAGVKIKGCQTLFRKQRHQKLKNSKHGKHGNNHWKHKQQ